MISVKINSENIQDVKMITTEGYSDNERLMIIRSISDNLGAEIFEFSSCNRVLFVGFSIRSDELENGICKYFNAPEGIFERRSGLDVWKHLVKVSSGLDSFVTGELQVLSQFRKSISFHKDNELISKKNMILFDQVIWGNRIIRKELGFNKTTESMINLATSTVKDISENKENYSSTILGMGDMGIKALETLLDMGHNNITIVSRDIEKRKKGFEKYKNSIHFLNFSDWSSHNNKTDLLISTIRNITPTFNKDTKIPINSNCTILDFSWPPSVDENSISEKHDLLGMKYLINASKKKGQDWNRELIIEEGEILLDKINQSYIKSLKQAKNSDFRSFVYKVFTDLSDNWKISEAIGETKKSHIEAFAKEIATWICDLHGVVKLNHLIEKIESTDREINKILLNRISDDVKRTVMELHNHLPHPEVRP